MADENVLAPAPTRSDDQILPFAAWVPIEKRNHVLDNPIFQIAMDILQNINFFRAFTASASVPAIYIQQFWNTLTYMEKAGTYQFQLDENWFTLDANLLREALEITPIDQAHPFVSPPSGDAIMDFVNKLGYPEMLWGIITSTNVDYAELMWEEFVKAMQTFLTDKANLGSPTKKGRKEKPHVIPYCRFTKLMICHMGRIHNIHQRLASPFHLAEENFRLDNLKFISKGEIDEVFRMSIPNELISNNIMKESYYNAYLEMVAKHDQKVAAKKEGNKKSPTGKFQPIIYLKFQESLKFLANEHVILEDPLSSTRTLSSMKNLEDAYAIGDQFINDKSTNDEPGKLQCEKAKVVSRICSNISSSSSVFTALEKKLFDLEQTNKNLDNTTQNLRSRVYTLELRDLPYKINEAVLTKFKRALNSPTSSPSRPLQRIIRRRYERNASPEDRDEFLDEKDKSRKRQRDDQDHPPPPPDSDQSKRRRHDVGSLANALATTYQALAENSLLEKTGDMQTFMNWYCQKMGKTELTQEDLEGQSYEVANPEGDQVKIDISKPLPLSGPPGHMKAACYHDFGLELLIPEHMWIDDICTYDISASYGISHWWFNRQKFYIDRHTAESSRKVVRTHTRILSVVRIKSYSRYGPEFAASSSSSKSSPGSDIRWDAIGFEFKHDYTIIDSPCAVVFLVSNSEQKIMRFNEIYKFSDGTLTNIMEALDYKVKEYKVNRLNPGINIWFWIDKDVKGARNSYMSLNGDSRPEGSSGI
ncbi:hypothetical protein Tco_0328639 [Tanacetum coccineum]